VHRTGYVLKRRRGRKSNLGSNEKVFFVKNANRPLKHVAKELGLSRERVRQLYEFFGIKRRSLRKWKARRGPEYFQKLKRLAEQGMLRDDAARELGVSVVTLQIHSKEYGVRFRTRWDYLLSLEAKGQRKCGRCHLIKALDEFCRRRSDRVGRSRTCRECMGAYRSKKSALLPGKTRSHFSAKT